MYQVYYNKQQPNNITESPPTQISVTSSQQFEVANNLQKTLGYTAAGGLVLSTTNTLIDSRLNASGNTQAQLTYAKGKGLLTGLVSLASIVRTAGASAGLGAFVIALTTSRMEKDTTELIAQIDNQYNMQKQGVSIKAFVGGGVRID